MSKNVRSIQAHSGPETLIFPYFGFSIVTTLNIDIIGSWSTMSVSQVIGIIFSMHSNKVRQTCWQQHYTVTNFVRVGSLAYSEMS